MREQPARGARHAPLRKSVWRMPALLQMLPALAPGLEVMLAGPRRMAFNALHLFSRGELVHPHVVVFMSGVPGSGKTTIINQRYSPVSVVLDLDRELAGHPRYDPADPDKLYFEGGTAVYDWADQRVETRFQEALGDRRVRRIVVDGTGTNVARQTRRMQSARDAGWFVKVLYVHIPIETAVRRAAARDRPIAPERVRNYQGKIGDALEQMAHLADEFEIFDAPSHDPAHMLMREGFADQSRTLVAAQEEVNRRARFGRIAHIRSEREVDWAHLDLHWQRKRVKRKRAP